MVSVSSLPAADLPQVRRLHNRFTDSSVSRETVESWYEDAPQLFVGAYEDDELVGYCLGLRRSEERVELHGIGVQPAYRREGIGTRLVEAFESRVARSDADRISVGSAGGYVDRFYRGNGYRPDSILVRVDPDESPANRDRTGFDVVDERREGDVRKLYVDVEEVDPVYINEVRGAFGDSEAVYIMEKAVE